MQAMRVPTFGHGSVGPLDFSGLLEEDLGPLIPVHLHGLLSLRLLLLQKALAIAEILRGEEEGALVCLEQGEVAVPLHMHEQVHGNDVIRGPFLI